MRQAKRRVPLANTMMKSSLKTGHKLYMNLAATTNKHQMGGQKDGDQESSPGYPGTAVLLLCGLGEEQDKQSLRYKRGFPKFAYTRVLMDMFQQKR